MFDVLVYTDATERESLNGLSGFRFIAKSAGATSRDEEVVRTRLQHIVPDDRLRAEDWQSHPHSCGYVSEGGRMYLARGASIGAALDGRPGNQLTQAIMSSDPYDVLPLRPAQLYSTPGWSIERPTGQKLSAWTSPLEISPEFDIPALHELVANNEWARTALPALLTMIEQTQGDLRVRLLIRHPDQCLVMRWIALLSRFLDAQAALGLEFRVYAKEPLRVNAHVVGVHPALSPELTVQRASGDVNLVDLENSSHTAITPTDSAQRHARWFLAGDPYEALDAVEVSRRWSRTMAPELAACAAELACLASNRSTVTSNDLLASVDALYALAMGGHGDELDAYGDALVDVIEGYPPLGCDDLPAIGKTLWALSKAGKTDLAQAVTLFMLEWARAQPDAAAAWAHASVPIGQQFVWPDAGVRARAAALLGAILSNTETQDLPAWFAFAPALDTGVAAADVAEPIGRLAAMWASDPTLTSSAPTWLHSADVCAALRNRVVGLLEQGDVAAISSLREGTWDWLGPQPWEFQLDNPLSVWLAVRVLPGADAPTRDAVLKAVLPYTQNAAWHLYLETPAGLGPKEVSAWVRAHGSIEPRFADRIERVIDDIAKHPVWQRGGAAHVLHSLGLEGGVGGLTPVLQTLVSDQQRILNLFEQAKSAKETVPNQALRSLAQSFGNLLTRIYGQWIVEAIVCTTDLDGALALAQVTDSDVAKRVASVLEKQMRDGEVAALETALRLLSPDRRAWNSVGKRALDALWSDRAAEGLRQKLTESLTESGKHPLRQTLTEYETKRSKGPLMRAWDLIRSPSLFKSKNKE